MVKDYKVGKSAKKGHQKGFEDKLSQQEKVLHVISGKELIIENYGDKEDIRADSGFLRLALTSDKVLIYNPDVDSSDDIILKYPQITEAEFEEISGRRIKISAGQRTITMNANKPKKEEINRAMDLLEEGPDNIEVAREKENDEKNNRKTNRNSLEDLKFRNVDWGSSEEDIIKSEGRNPQEKSEEGRVKTLIFTDNLKSVEVIAKYFLVDNKVVHGNYFSQQIFRDSEAERKFDELKNLFERKYGDPVQDLSLENEEKIRKAGYCRAAEWKGLNKGISLNLSYNAGVYQIEIAYQKDDLFKKLEDARDENTSNKI
jgi:hypothetical protein